MANQSQERLLDVNFFLKQRTAFSGGFFDEAIAGFQETQRRIDQAVPPFDNPPYSDTYWKQMKM